MLPLARPGFDMTRAADLRQLGEWHPEVVINAAAWTDVDACARDPQRAFLVNGTAAGMVASAARHLGALVVQVSTNEVFDGDCDRPYTEADSPNPINPYGASKLLGEHLVADATPRHVIVRTAWLFGPDGDSFVTRIWAAAANARVSDEPLRVVGDEWGNPTFTPWLAESIVEIVGAAVQDVSVCGVYHRVGTPAVTRYGWARRVLARDETKIVEIPHTEFDRASRPPLRAILSSIRPPFTPGAAWEAATEARVAAMRASAASDGAR